jgi:hypothetical protein
LSTPNLSNDKEVSNKAHSFITTPLKTPHELQASILQCLKEPSYVKILKDLCTRARKSKNRCPKKLFRSKQVGYLRWQNILSECYQILRKKWWKGFIEHPNDHGKHGNFYFFFFAFNSEFFFLFHFISCQFFFF